MKRVVEIKAGDVTVRATLNTAGYERLVRAEVEAVVSALADRIMGVCAALPYGAGASICEQKVKK